MPSLPILLLVVGGGALGLYGVYRALGGSAMGQRVYVRSGRLYGPSRSVPITDADLLWLARALVGETGGEDETAAAAVAWAIAQNCMLVSRPAPFATLTAAVRAYSIPTSTDYLDPTSAKCQRNPTACTPARIARRREIQAMGWTEIPAATKNVVGRFLRGTLPNPVPGAVDFAAYRFAGATVQIGGNWFGVGASRRLL